MINQLVMSHQSNKIVAMFAMRNIKHHHTSFIPSSRLPKTRRICLQHRLYSHSIQSSTPYHISEENDSISKSSQYNTNKYERFRQEINSAINLDNINSCSDDPILYKTNLINVGKRSIEVISPNRRSFNRTWKRMKPMIDIVLTSCKESEVGDTTKQSDIQLDRRISSLVDVGCDHGMLSISLATISWVTQQQYIKVDDDKENKSHNNDKSKSVSNGISFFPPTRIFGTDLSLIALENGGLVSLKKINEAMMPLSRFDNDLPIELRVGDGLKPLQKGEADAIILAGMGIMTMLNILQDDVDRVHTKRIFVQPTNSRPQHLILLYEKLQQSSEWVLRDETISYLGGRWYINAYFERFSREKDADKNSFHFPGHFLVQSDTEEDIDAYDSYVKHHLRWLKEDFERPKCVLEDEDKRWLEYIQSADENAQWNALSSWYSQ